MSHFLVKLIQAWKILDSLESFMLIEENMLQKLSFCRHVSGQILIICTQRANSIILQPT